MESKRLLCNRFSLVLRLWDNLIRNVSTKARTMSGSQYPLDKYLLGGETEK